MRPSQWRHRGGEVLVERRCLGAVFDEVLVQLQHDRAGIPVGAVRDRGGVAQLAQGRHVGFRGDGLAQRLGHRVVHGLDGPHSRNVNGRKAAVRTRPHDHLGAIGRRRGVLDDLPAAVDPDVVVGVCLIRLQQGELGVVAEVHPLVAEGAAKLEDALDTAHAQPLQVQLGRDAQVQIQVVGVDVGLERAGVRAAVDLLQDRGLDLQESLAHQRFPDGVQHAAAGGDQLSRLGVDRQVQISGADAGLGVGQALPLVGQRTQALADQAPVVRQHRYRAVAAGAHDAGDLDQVAEVDRPGELRHGAVRQE